MYSRDSQLGRRARRARLRSGATALERLEDRQLMAYTSLGFSLPDLAVSGASAPSTTWGGTLTVSVTVQNLGASTIVEPTSLVPPTQVGIGPDGTVVPAYYTPSQADVPASTVAVYLVPRGRGIGRGIQLGVIDAPAISQNSITQFESTVTLPERPAGFPAAGSYTIRLVANATKTVVESNYRNNVSEPLNVQITPAPATPMLRVTTFDVPELLTPGDTIAPYIQVANLGAAAVGSEVEVAVVASTTPDFNLGSSVVALYTVDGIDGVSSVPLPNGVRHKALTRAFSRNNIITPRNNVATINGGAAILPTSPRSYYLGVVVDPYNKLDLPNRPANRLEQIQRVTSAGGDASSGATGVVATYDFQYPPDGVPVGIA